MLEIRPCCENCEKELLPNNTEAMICSFECTYCTNCVENVLFNVCPNCGGGFEKRPVRPSSELIKYPAISKRIIKPVTENSYLDANKDIDPQLR